jgi:hypothetical protein
MTQGRPPVAPEIRFWAKVNKTDSCWLWTARCFENGYGQFANGAGKTVRAHRFAYELLVGPIPPELKIDHLCHNEDTKCPGGTSCVHRRCVNPSHLEPATQKANVQRGRLPGLLRRTHCPKGHPYNEENTWRDKDGGKHCRTCHRLRMRASYIPRVPKGTTASPLRSELLSETDETCPR